MPVCTVPFAALQKPPSRALLTPQRHGRVLAALALERLRNAEKYSLLLLLRCRYGQKSGAETGKEAAEHLQQIKQNVEALARVEWEAQTSFLVLKRKWQRLH